MQIEDADENAHATSFDKPKVESFLITHVFTFNYLYVIIYMSL